MSVKQTAPSGDSAMARHAASMVFPIGAPNDGFAQYFTGRSFLIAVKRTLYPFKEFIINDSWHPTRSFGIFVDIISDIAFVPQKAV